MKNTAKALILFALLALFVTSGHAQDTASQSIQHFTLSGSAMAFKGVSGTQAASIGQASLQLTSRVDIGYEQITVPTLATWDLGVAGYALPLNSLLGKKISSHFAFDSSGYKVHFQAGIGKVMQSTQSVSRIAETAGVYLTKDVANHITLRIIGGEWLHGGVQNGFIVTPSTAAISSGLSISF